MFSKKAHIDQMGCDFPVSKCLEKKKYIQDESPEREENVSHLQVGWVDSSGRPLKVTNS